LKVKNNYIMFICQPDCLHAPAYLFFLFLSDVPFRVFPAFLNVFMMV